MLTKINKHFGERQLFVSITGKLWINNTFYDPNTDSILNESEELYVSGKNREVYYTRKINNMKIIISHPEYSNMDKQGTIKALREISDCLTEKYLHARTIKINYSGIYINEGRGFYNLRNTMKPLYLDDESPELYIVCSKMKKKQHKAILRALDKYTYIPEAYIIAKYIIIPDMYNISIVHVYDSLEKPHEMAHTIKRSKRVNYIEEYRPEIKTWKGVEFFGGEEISKLYSPPKIPPNAFLINKEEHFDILLRQVNKVSHRTLSGSVFIQFTKNGVLFTNGIFFAKEPLEEVRKPWYIVEKTEDGWDIYIYGHPTYSGFYRIKDGQLFSYDDPPYELQQVNIEKDYWNKIQRVPVKTNSKTFYIPNVLIEKMFMLQPSIISTKKTNQQQYGFLLLFDYNSPIYQENTINYDTGDRE